MVGKDEVKAGQEFTLQVAADTTLDQVRQLALEDFGRDVHIKAMFGPIIELKDGGLGGKFEAVDDPVLKGSFPIDTLIRMSEDGSISYIPDIVVYFGYFK